MELSNRRMVKLVELLSRRMTVWWNGRVGGVAESSKCGMAELVEMSNC